jgi:hypothetical protein
MKDGKFKVGDKVKVKKPVNVYENPCWDRNMDKYDGGEYVIRYKSGWILLEGCVGRTLNHSRLSSFWRFNAKWLTLVESIEGACSDCGSEMKDVQLFTSTTKMCPKCKK